MNFLLEHLQVFFEWVIRASLYSTALIVLVFVTLSIFNRFLNAHLRYLLWLLVVIRLLLPMEVESSLSLFNLKSAVSSSSAIPTAERITAGKPEKESIAKEILSEPKQKQASTSFTNNRLDLKTLLFGIWLSGVLLFLGKLFWDALSFSNVIHRKRPVTESSLLTLLEDCKDELNVNTPVSLVITPKVSSPLLMGWLRPRILFPENLLDSLKNNELRCILLHELGHVKRIDIAANWLFSILHSLHWFNPFVWFVFARMRTEREQACDALVLSRVVSVHNKQYGQTIIKLLDQLPHPPLMANLAGVLERKNQMKQRIHAISKFNRTKQPRAYVATILAIILSALGLTQAKQGGHSLSNEFPYEVSFETGQSAFFDGDSITITHIYGDKPTIKLGGNYLVKGHYTLESMDEGILSTSIMTPGSVSLKESGLEKAVIKKGVGKFSLVRKMIAGGWPNISLYPNIKKAPSNSDNRVGILFYGQGEWLYDLDNDIEIFEPEKIVASLEPLKSARIAKVFWADSKERQGHMQRDVVDQLQAGGKRLLFARVSNVGGNWNKLKTFIESAGNSFELLSSTGHRIPLASYGGVSNQSTCDLMFLIEEKDFNAMVARERYVFENLNTGGDSIWEIQPNVHIFKAVE